MSEERRVCVSTSCDETVRKSSWYRVSVLWEMNIESISDILVLIHIENAEGFILNSCLFNDISFDIMSDNPGFQLPVPHNVFCMPMLEKP